MKRWVMALSVCGAGTGVCLADVAYKADGIELAAYGILDAGLGAVEHSYSASDVFVSGINPYNLNSSPDSYTGVIGSGISMSRLGIKGRIDAGQALSAFFKAETAVNVTTGVLSNNGQSIYNDIGGLKSANGASAIDGQLFSRAAFVGIAHRTLGQLEAGRTTNFSLDQVAEYDPVQAAFVYSPLGFSGGIGGGLGATENTRYDNSLKYEYARSGFGAGLQYKFAGSKATQSAGSGWAAMLSYARGPFSAKATFAQTRNSVVYATQYSNVVAPDSNLQIENTRGYMLTTLYRLTDRATLKGGYEYSVISAPSDAQLTSIRQYYGLLLPQPAVNATGEQHFQTEWVGGDYHVTRAFDLALGYFNINTDNKPEVKKDYRSSVESVLADYRWVATFDTYAGLMMLQYTGEGLQKKAPVLAYSSNRVYGVGMRYQF